LSTSTNRYFEEGGYIPPVSQTDKWDRITHLYHLGATIPELALRFKLTNQAIRYVLTKRNVLRKKENKCGVSVSAS
jgi:hypothetical protein